MGPISAVRQVFQMYRLGTDGFVWWRMVSPNGRVLARSAHAHPSVEAAGASIAQVRLRASDLEPSMRLTPSARWHWVLALDGQPIVESLRDLDRRVRCDQAWRSFTALAPTAALDLVVHGFRSSAPLVGAVVLR